MDANDEQRVDPRQFIELMVVFCSGRIAFCSGMERINRNREMSRQLHYANNGAGRELYESSSIMRQFI
jgi:hypothetical protein